MSMTRKRLWLLIVAALAIAFLGGLLRPRIDPRLVGAWITPSNPRLRLNLEASGFGVLTVLGDPDTTTPILLTKTVRWHVEDQVLFLDDRGPDVAGMLWDVYRRANGWSPGYLVRARIQPDRDARAVAPGENVWVRTGR